MLLSRALLYRPLQSGFGEVNITLNPPQSLIVNGFFVAELDNGFAFGFERFSGQSLEIGREQSADTLFVRRLVAQFTDAVAIFRAKTLDNFGPRALRYRVRFQTSQCRFVGL